MIKLNTDKSAAVNQALTWLSIDEVPPPVGAKLLLIKRANLTGAKVKTTKAYKSDGKPRCWLVFPPVPENPKTQIRGNFPK